MKAAGLTVDDGAGAKVLTEKVRVQSCAGEDQLQRGKLLKHLPQFGEQEIGQAVPFVHLVLFTHGEGGRFLADQSQNGKCRLRIALCSPQSRA